MAKHMATNTGHDKAKLSTLVIFVGFLIIACAVFAIDIIDGVPFAGDIDDRMRRIQIQDLLSDNQWHDLTIPAIAMPEAYISPWSRLVDAPYVLLAKLLSISMPETQALNISIFIIPPLLFMPCAYFVIKIIQAIVQRPLPPVVWGVTFIGFLLILTEFSPTRIDHHNIQFICLLMMIWGIFTTSKYGGYLSGLAIVLSISIGLEALPHIIIFLAAIISLAAIGKVHIRQNLRKIGIAISGLTLPMSLCLIGQSGILSTQCDALSAPWILGLTGGGFILWLIPLSWNPTLFDTTGKLLRPWTALLRLAAFAPPVIILTLVLAALYPICLQGPLHMIDDVSRDFWLNNIAQEHSMFWVARNGMHDAFVTTYILLASLLIAFFALFKPHAKTLPPALIILTVVTIFAGLMGLLQMRSYRFFMLLTPLFIPSIILGFMALNNNPAKRLQVLLATTIPLFICMGFMAVMPKSEFIIDGRAIMEIDSCEHQDFTVLKSIPASRIIAPLGLSLTLLEQPHGHQIVTNGFHRGAPGIKRIAQTFMNVPNTVRKEALKPFDYLAICTINTKYDLSDAPLYAALTSKRNWPGLIDITPENDSRLKLYKINHENLP